MGKPLFGPKNGFRNQGDIECKNLSVSGVITAGVTVDTGVVDSDITLKAGHDLGCQAGDTKVDFGSGTGIFKTPTGDATLGGDTTIAADKDLKAAAGTGEVDLSPMTGAFKSPAGANTLSGDVTIASGKKFTKGATLNRILSKAVDYAVSDTDPDIILVDASGGNKTITLPTAADNAGRIITVVVAVEPGANNVVVDGEGAETINGAATKTNSTLYDSLILLCTGTAWIIIGGVGTWT